MGPANPEAQPAMKRKNLLLASGFLFALVTGMVLLGLGAYRDLISPREWGFGLLAWPVVVVTSTVLLRRRVLQQSGGDSPAVQTIESVRRHQSRRIRKWKVWIITLVVLFPIGILNGMAHHAWLPTFGGAIVSLAIIYVGIREIRRLRKQADSTQP